MAAPIKQGYVYYDVYHGVPLTPEVCLNDQSFDLLFSFKCWIFDLMKVIDQSNILNSSIEAGGYLAILALPQKEVTPSLLNFLKVFFPFTFPYFVSFIFLFSPHILFRFSFRLWQLWLVYRYPLTQTRTWSCHRRWYPFRRPPLPLQRPAAWLPSQQIRAICSKYKVILFLFLCLSFHLISLSFDFFLSFSFFFLFLVFLFLSLISFSFIAPNLLSQFLKEPKLKEATWPG